MDSIPEKKITADTVRLWRFLSGAPLDGIPRSDAGWTTRGTRPTGNGRCGRWGLLSRAERAGIRLGGTAAGIGAAYGSVAAPDVTAWTLGSIGAAGTVAAGYGTAERLCNVLHHRNWIHPLHLALVGPLGLPDGMTHRMYIRIPRDYPERTDVGRIDLPPEFARDGADVAGIIRAKLALSDVSVSYKLAGRRPHLVLTQTPRPPAQALFTSPEIRELVEQAPQSSPVIGLGPRGSTVSVDLDSESPHILVSASTGGGKSVITRTMTSQLLHHGAQLAVLDFKRHSHKWAKGLPSVNYARDISDIHDVLVTLGREGNRRNVLVDDWDGDEKDCPVGPRIGILLEEANATISKLKRYWTQIREKDDPKESPAIDALREVLFMGRAVKMHVFLVAQSATANALGGPEVRECFATRILARYTKNAWNMLVPEVQPVPRSTRKIGRAQVVLGGVAHETQVVFFENDDARAWALSGTVAGPLDLDLLGGPLTATQPHTAPIHLGKEAVSLTGQGPTGRHLRAVPGPAGPVDPEPVGLREAVESGILGCSLAVARTARAKDPEFPRETAKRGTEKVYRPADLQRWERNRPSAKTADSAL